MSGPGADLKEHSSAMGKKTENCRSYSQSAACLLIAGQLLLWKEVRKSVHANASACRFFFWGKCSFLSLFQMFKISKAPHQSWEKGKPVNVTLVPDDERYAPPPLCPEKGSKYFLWRALSSELGRPLCSSPCTERDPLLGTLVSWTCVSRGCTRWPRRPFQPQACCGSVPAFVEPVRELLPVESRQLSWYFSADEELRCVSDYFLGSDMSDIYFLLKNHSGLQLLSSGNLQNSWPTLPFNFFPWF